MQRRFVPALRTSKAIEIVWESAETLAAECYRRRARFRIRSHVPSEGSLSLPPVRIKHVSTVPIP